MDLCVFNLANLGSRSSSPCRLVESAMAKLASSSEKCRAADCGRNDVMGTLPTIVRFLVTGLLLKGVVLAQISSGWFRGQIRDPSNAVVPQAKVLIRSNENGME